MTVAMNARWLMSFGSLSVIVFALSVAGCKEDKAGIRAGSPPPGVSLGSAPPPSAETKPGACAAGGGALTDPVSASFFSRSVSGYCVDPQGDIKTYGERGKLSMDEVCTTAFDGECEVYKRFGLRRVVSLRYVDAAGKGGTVEVNLSQFGDVAGAYGMFTMRVVAADPAEPSTPKQLSAGAAGAIGTGRAYVWRGQHLVELQYVNENESPEQLVRSSEAILTAVGKDIGTRLPGPTTLPPAAQALPSEHRIASGITFHPKELFGANVGPAAVAYYKDGDRRWRMVAIVKDDVEQAKEAFKALRSKPGSLTVPAVSGEDEAAKVTVPLDASKKRTVDMLLARKGREVWGVLDEEYAVAEKQGADREKAKVSPQEAAARLKAVLASPTPAASGKPQSK